MTRIFKKHLTHAEIEQAAHRLATELAPAAEFKPIKLFPVPRGGVAAAYMLAKFLEAEIVENPLEATFLVDDLVDSGGTRTKWLASYPHAKFVALFDKTNPFSDEEIRNSWLVFPWESDTKSADDSIVGTITNRFKIDNVSFLANDNISAHLLPGEMDLVEAEVARRMESVLAGLLIDTKTCHNSMETSKRVAKMYCREIYRGRYEKPPTITDFPNVKKLEDMYMTGPITIRSSCSHHMCPIIGKAWIGIVPGPRVVGLSKFNRIVDWVCSRPQIQEEMVVQIADHLEKVLGGPKGLAVVIKASHTCMTWRGVREHPEAEMTTNVMRGIFRDQPEARGEFLASITS